MYLGPNTKAWVAAVGATATAVSTFLASISLVVGDDAISFEEVGSLAMAAATLAGTIYGVWRADNFKTKSQVD